MAINKEVDHIRALISQDKLQEAIESIKRLVDTIPQLNEILLHSAKYHDINKQIRLGLIDFSSANVTKNQLRNSIIEMLSEIEGLSQKSPNAKLPLGVKNNKVFYILIIVIITIALIYFQSASNFNGIKGDNNDNNTIIQGK